MFLYKFRLRVCVNSKPVTYITCYTKVDIHARPFFDRSCTKYSFFKTGGSFIIYYCSSQKFREIFHEFFVKYCEI